MTEFSLIMSLPVKKTVITEVDDQLAGANVRTKREDAGMSQKELASELGVSKNFISLLEIGKRGWDKERYSLALKVISEYKDKAKQ